jgi:AAA domain
MKITHVYPRWDKDQQPVGGTLTDVEVWEEIRGLTVRDGGVLFVETHQYAKEEFLEGLEKGRFDRSQVHVLSLDPIKKAIHIPAQGPIESKLVRASDGKVIGTHQVHAQPATVKEIVVERYLDFSTIKHARFIASKVTNLVVIWEPYVEAGDLDYVHELKDADVVIFHRPSEKWGVVVDGDVDPDNWAAEFPVMGECDIPKVEVIVDDLLIKGGIHVWAGMFESYKTVAAIELSSAILQNRKVFDQFEVRKQYPILYLCPDMPPELFQEYTRPFGLMNDKEFRWMKPGGDTFHMIDSAVMERAAKGRVLILDTMLDYAQIQKAFESGEWIAFFAKLRRLINVCGCAAIVMLVHPTKTGAKSNTIDPSEYLKDSVTFGGKIDVGFGYSKLTTTSQVMVERIKGRGFKKQQFSFSIAYLDDDGNSNLDRGRFPVYLKPGEAGKKEDHVVKDKAGRKPNPERDVIADKIAHLKGKGKSFPQIAEQLQLSLSMVKRYSKPTFDANQGD